MTYLQPPLPPICLRVSEIDRLWNIAESASNAYPQTTAFLKREIERAEILTASRVLVGLVTMNSEVTFRDDISSQERTVELTYPDEADIEANKISILTPIGAALIGLSVGQTIEFQNPGGRWRSLTVVKANPPLSMP
jgi:regulator of nucleoside diphosphate kinase